MIERNIDIRELEALFGNMHTNSRLRDKIRVEGWGDIPPISVIEIPEKLRRGE